MDVLSLCDGISCGYVALERAGISVKNYYAYEIDKYAIQVSKTNCPQIKQCGSVVNADFTPYRNIDLLMAGTPCTGFSVAGKHLNFNDPQSSLFFEFVRALKECKPKYFLLENVKMKSEWQDIISSYVGVQPVEINSSLFSAQNRRRLYWTNIPISALPKENMLLVKDILHEYCHDDIDLTPYIIYRDGLIVESNNKRRYGYFKRIAQGNTVYNIDYKAITLVSSGGQKNLYKIGDYIRTLTPIECERLQTLPDNYTAGISKTQRYKCLGNGWTVDVIAHILKGIK